MATGLQQPVSWPEGADVDGAAARRDYRQAVHDGRGRVIRHARPRA